jgi:hypothetical protein
MPKKKLTEKMLKEIVNNFPKPLIDYWIANSSKPIDVLQSYTIGFHDGMVYVIKTLEPHMKEWTKS